MLAYETVASSKSIRDEQLLSSKLIESMLSFRTTFWLVFILQTHASNALSIRFLGSGFVHTIVISFLFCSSVLIEVLRYCSREATTLRNHHCARYSNRFHLYLPAIGRIGLLCKIYMAQVKITFHGRDVNWKVIVVVVLNRGQSCESLLSYMVGFVVRLGIQFNFEL